METSLGAYEFAVEFGDVVVDLGHNKTNYLANKMHKILCSSSFLKPFEQTLEDLLTASL